MACMGSLSYAWDTRGAEILGGGGYPQSNPSCLVLVVTAMHQCFPPKPKTYYGEENFVTINNFNHWVVRSHSCRHQSQQVQTRWRVKSTRLSCRWWLVRYRSRQRRQLLLNLMSPTTMAMSPIAPPAMTTQSIGRSHRRKRSEPSAKTHATMIVAAMAQAEMAMAQAGIAAEIEAAHHTPKVNCVKRNKKEEGVEVEVCTCSTLLALMGQAHSKVGEQWLGSVETSFHPIEPKAQITKENILSFKKSYYFLELKFQARFNLEHLEICFMRLTGRNKFVVSPIRQWTPVEFICKNVQ